MVIAVLDCVSIVNFTLDPSLVAQFQFDSTNPIRTIELYDSLRLPNLFINKPECINYAFLYLLPFQLRIFSNF